MRHFFVFALMLLVAPVASAETLSDDQLDEIRREAEARERAKNDIDLSGGPGGAGDAKLVGPGLCETTEGPFGCTGRFGGTTEFTNSSARKPSAVTLILERDGRAALQFPGFSGPTAFGKVDSSGSVVIDTPDYHTELRLTKVPAAAGLAVAGTGTTVGRGTYDRPSFKQSYSFSGAAPVALATPGEDGCDDDFGQLIGERKRRPRNKDGSCD